MFGAASNPIWFFFFSSLSLSSRFSHPQLPPSGREWNPVVLPFSRPSLLDISALIERNGHGRTFQTSVCSFWIFYYSVQLLQWRLGCHSRRCLCSQSNPSFPFSGFVCFRVALNCKTHVTNPTNLVILFYFIIICWIPKMNGRLYMEVVWLLLMVLWWGEAWRLKTEFLLCYFVDFFNFRQWDFFSFSCDHLEKLLRIHCIVWCFLTSWRWDFLNLQNDSFVHCDVFQNDVTYHFQYINV